MTFEELQEMHDKALISAKYWQQRAERAEARCNRLRGALTYLYEHCAGARGNALERAFNILESTKENQ